MKDNASIQSQCRRPGALGVRCARWTRAADIAKRCPCQDIRPCPGSWPSNPSFGGGGRGGRVVYCGGLENRFGFTADGGSNPSLSASAAGPGRWLPGLTRVRGKY